MFIFRASINRDPKTRLLASGSQEIYRDGESGSAQNPVHRLDDVLDMVERLVEGFFIGGVEIDVDDLFDAAGADHDRNAKIVTADAVLPLEQRGAGQDFLL